jgi:hypothetical protein
MRRLGLSAECAGSLVIQKVRQPSAIAFGCILKALRRGLVQPRDRLEGALSVLLLRRSQTQLFFEFETRRTKDRVSPSGPFSGFNERLKSQAGYLYSAENVSASLFISSAPAACENKITR